jgi:hypothetical protein
VPFYFHGTPYLKSPSLTGSAGQAVISKTTAYLVTNPQYWLQAQAELDNNWHVILAGSIDGPKDWIEWLIVSLLIPLVPHFPDANI